MAQDVPAILTLKLSGSLDEAREKKVVEPGSWLRLHNAVVDRAGTVTPRNGYGTLPREALVSTVPQQVDEDALPVSAPRLLAHGDELLAIGGAGDGTAELDARYQHLFSYSEPQQFWMPRGLPAQFEARKRPALRTSDGVYAPVVADTSEQIRWWAWQNVDQDAVLVEAFDRATGAVMAREHGTGVRYYYTGFARGGAFVLVGRSNSSPTDVLRSVFSVGIYGTDGTTDTIASASTALEYLDASPGLTFNEFYVVFWDKETEDERLRVERWDLESSSPLASVDIPTTANGVKAVAIDATSSDVHVAWLDSTDNKIYVQSFRADDLSPNYAVATVASSVGAANISRLSVGRRPFGGGPIVLWEDIQVPSLPFVVVSKHNALGVQIDQQLVYGVRIYSRPFLQGTLPCTTLLYQASESVQAKGGVYGTACVVALDSIEASAEGYAHPIWLGAVGVGETIYVHTPGIGTTRQIPCTPVAPVAGVSGQYVFPICTLLQGLPAKEPDLGADEATLDWTPSRTNAYQAAEPARSLLLSGGLTTSYDRSSVVEVGFLDAPLITLEIEGTGGAMPDGSYQYCAVYEWYDGVNYHVSRPSLPVIASVEEGTGTASVTVTAKCLGLTKREELSPETARNVRLALFRTVAGGDVFYRLSKRADNGTINSISSPTVVFPVDTLPDDDLVALGYGTLYTSGGVLENAMPPPSLGVLLHKQRVWIISADDDHDIWYSKLLFEGEAPAFAAEFRVRLEDGERGATALAALDDALVIFTADRIYLVRGDGPNDTGLGGAFSEPELVSSDTGCSAPRSVVQSSTGVYFQGTGGIYQLTRRGEVVLVSEPILNTIESRPYVLRATRDPGRQRLYFLLGETSETADTVACFDYGFGVWTTWGFGAGGIVDQCLWRGLHAFTDAAGVELENWSFVGRVGGHPLGYDRDNSFVGLVVETPWVKGGGMGGKQSVRKARLVGEQNGSCLVTASVYYDYADTPTGEVQFVLDDSSTFRDLPIVRAGWRLRRPRCEAVKVKVSVGQYRPVSASPNGISLSAIALDLAPLPGSSKVAVANKR